MYGLTGAEYTNRNGHVDERPPEYGTNRMEHVEAPARPYSASTEDKAPRYETISPGACRSLTEAIQRGVNNSSTSAPDRKTNLTSERRYQGMDALNTARQTMTRIGNTAVEKGQDTARGLPSGWELYELTPAKICPLAGFGKNTLVL